MDLDEKIMSDEEISMICNMKAHLGSSKNVDY